MVKGLFVSFSRNVHQKCASIESHLAPAGSCQERASPDSMTEKGQSPLLMAAEQALDSGGSNG